MNKRGISDTLITAAILLFLLVVILVLVMGPDALLQKAAYGFEWIADSILGKLRVEKYDQTKIESDAALEETYDNLVNALRSKGNGPCRIEAKQFTKDFKDFRITLSQGDESTATFVQLINKRGQSVKRNTISGLSPCIVSERNAAKNFHNNYLSSVPCSSNCPLSYTVANIEFIENKKMKVNGREKEIQVANLLFKERDGNICFFPTYSGWFTSIGCDAREDGLDDDCIKIIRDKMDICSESLSVSISSTAQRASGRAACSAIKAVVANIGTLEWSNIDRIKLFLRCKNLSIDNKVSAVIRFKRPEAAGSYINLKPKESKEFIFEPAYCVEGEEYTMELMQHCTDTGKDIKDATLDCDNSNSLDKPLPVASQKFRC